MCNGYRCMCFGDEFETIQKQQKVHAFLRIFQYAEAKSSLLQRATKLTSSKKWNGARLADAHSEF